MSGEEEEEERNFPNKEREEGAVIKKGPLLKDDMFRRPSYTPP